MEAHPYEYETWKEQGEPTCPECERPVLLGFSHFCEVKQEMVKLAMPKKMEKHL